ncbi:O-antigen ligase [Oceanospirillum multiglobuliferum]|uniref:O-antigen ligase-related domain-containing protein n=1 Tax=Oceanospirillum multiglobuliferum TaxID=64969 RepID=A0A1T4S9A4_9GAMM|nr:O-antigen ligase family protein [Oceanospirillum multiglobuliferum]OPX54368.1 hypothetical protein BTE48_14595 [Oceanospirillum multiglobuliferum]SKA24757.1 O-antigen ligase [Oceanospirillum multiglobuliferum]
MQCIPEKIFNSYNNIAVFLFFVLALIIPSGYSYGATLLLFGALFHFFVHNENNVPFQIKNTKYILALLITYFSIQLISVLIHHEEARELDKSARFLLAAFVLYALTKFPIRSKVFWASVAAGAVTTGLFALYQRYHLGVYRVGGTNNPIQYGNISMLLGVLSLAGLTWALEKKRKLLWCSLLITGAFLAILASFFSLSRGGWIGLPIIIIFIISNLSTSISKKTVIISLSIAMLSLFSAYKIESIGIKHRVDEAFSNIEHYIDGSNQGTSVGIRFNLWINAYQLFSEKPIFGHGKEGYITTKNEYINNNQASPHIGHFNQAHNEILDTMAKRGLFGLSALFALYIIPVLLFKPYLKHKNSDVRASAMAGCLLSFCYFDFGLTQGFLLHNSGTMMFAFTLVIITSVFTQELRRANHSRCTDC